MIYFVWKSQGKWILQSSRNPGMFVVELLIVFVIVKFLKMNILYQ